VAAGGLLTLLPPRPLLGVTAVLFAIGSYILLRGAGRAAEEEAEEEEDYEKEVARRAHADGVQAAVTSFSSCSPRNAEITGHGVTLADHCDS
jgi:hypothetical protein